MNAGKSLRLPGLAALAAAAMAIAGGAAAQDVSLNYERLSSMEEPLAAEIGGATFVLKGLVDAALIHDAEDGDTDAGLTGNFQLGALTQLSNRWRVGLTYFGQYVTDETLSTPPDDRYTDRAALSVGGMWGTVAGGNGLRDRSRGTRRGRGAGNAALAFDDALAGSPNGARLHRPVRPLGGRRRRRRRRRFRNRRDLPAPDGLTPIIA